MNYKKDLSRILYRNMGRGVRCKPRRSHPNTESSYTTGTGDNRGPRAPIPVSGQEDTFWDSKVCLRRIQEQKEMTNTFTFESTILVVKSGGHVSRLSRHRKGSVTGDPSAGEGRDDDTVLRLGGTEKVLSKRGVGAPSTEREE